jgi:hypothetical protein
VFPPENKNKKPKEKLVIFTVPMKQKITKYVDDF